jgi:hypothetical protein
MLSYVGIDDHGNEKEQGMGKTIDISIGGIFIETRYPIVSKDILLTVIGINHKLIDIEGKIVHQRAEDSGMFQTGIQFLENIEKTRFFIMGLIQYL